MKLPTNVARKVRYEYGPNRKKIRRLNFANLTATSTNDGVIHVDPRSALRPNGSRRVATPVPVGGPSSRRRRRAPRIERQYLLTDARVDVRGTDGLGQPVNAYASMSFEPFGARRDPILGHVPSFWWASGLGLYRILHAARFQARATDAFGIHIWLSIRSVTRRPNPLRAGSTERKRA